MVNVVWVKLGASKELPNVVRCCCCCTWVEILLIFRPGVLLVTSFKTLFIIKFSSTCAHLTLKLGGHVDIFI